MSSIRPGSAEDVLEGHAVDAVCLGHRLAGQPAVVVFGRYLGCPICQLQMDDLKQGVDVLRSRGAKVFYVLQSPVATVTSASEEKDWPFEIVSDPEAKVFAAYQVPYGNPLKLVGPGLTQAVRRS